MRKISIFLMQATNEQNDQLKKLFSNEENFEIVGQSTESISAVSLIAEKKPRALIVEIVISGGDGLSLVRKVKALNLPIKIIVLSAMNRDEIIKQAVDAGADYFMAKPLNFELLKERIIELDEEKETKKEPSFRSRNTLDERISNIFINVGIPPHIKGYAFLREAVKMAIEKPEMVNNITKKLYPAIGEKFNTSASKVERAIRHAIEVAWSRGRIESINNILGVRAFVGKEKPTNGEFIALVADKMLLEMA